MFFSLTSLFSTETHLLCVQNWDIWCVSESDLSSGVPCAHGQFYQCFLTLNFFQQVGGWAYRIWNSNTTSLDLCQQNSGKFHSGWDFKAHIGSVRYLEVIEEPMMATCGAIEERTQKEDPEFITMRWTIPAAVGICCTGTSIPSWTVVLWRRWMDGLQYTK